MTASDTIRDLPVAVKRCPECGLRFGLEAAFCPFDGIALSSGTWDRSADPLTGKRVDGRYEVLEPLGEGGMGTVYRVRHATLDRLFAMKVLRHDLADDTELAHRFVREAKATAAVKHPGVVAITDFGELEGGDPYYVMELLVGETLATRIRARGPASAEDAIKVACKIAEALEASHAAGVVHRDLKPENVFLVGKSLGRAAEDDIRIVDFGAARVVGSSRLTRPGVVFGTPYYMSPEQASGQNVDARADVYSLGVLLYEMVTGVLPFQADTYMGVLTKHMFQKPVKPSERVSSGVQLGGLEDVILRALEKDPAARFPSMIAMSTALADARRPASAVAPRGGTARMPLAPGASTADRIGQAVEKQHAEEQRRKRTLVLVTTFAATATVLLGASALWLTHVGGARAAPNAEAPPPRPQVSSRPVAPSPPPPPPTLPVETAEPASSEAPAVGASAPASPTTKPRESRPVGARTVAPAPPPSPPPVPAPRKATGAEDFPDPWKR